MSEDFLGQTSHSSAEFDFDRAASAFPDIDDFGGDAPIPAPAPTQNGASFANDFDFDGPAQFNSSMKVTEPDELDKFTTDFPELEPQVCRLQPIGPSSLVYSTSATSRLPYLALP
jgi:hypothetical protein